MSAEQLDLVPESAGRGPARLVELAVRRAIKAGHDSKQLTEQDAGIAATAIACARRLDSTGDPFATAPLVNQLRETLAELGLTPRARGGASADPFAELTAQLAQLDPAAGSQVGNPTE